MDDTTTLVSDLLNKLAELNQRVCDYRQEMGDEFQRYSHRLLQDAPEHVSVRVGEVLAEELHNYSALSPALVTLNGTAVDLVGRSDAERWSRRGRVSPPPVLPHTSGVPPHDVTSGSPPDRDRDREFHGLFTPSYLPLLEVVQPSKAVHSPPIAASSLPTSCDNESNITQEPSPRSPIDIAPSTPETVHRLMEDTMSSNNSDDSISRTRRSALRRSSSGSTKDVVSPRRVRFDVEGEEVLPTVSPPGSPRINELLTSPPSDNMVNPNHESLNHTAPEDGASILGNSPPRPKKISSTERLKALARISTEDTSKWTVVGDTLDDDEEEEGLVMFTSKKKPQISSVEPASTKTMNNGIRSDRVQIEKSKDLVEDTHNNHALDEEEIADDLLELTPLSSFKDKKRFSPPKRAQQSIPEVTPNKISTSQQLLPSETNPHGSALLSQTHGALYGEEEEMFDFDDDQSASQSRSAQPASKYIQEVEEEPEVETEKQITSAMDKSDENSTTTLYSTSPAIPIAKPATPPLASPVSSLPKFVSASAGSYKGKPFIIGVVRDEDLHKRAIEMGDFSTFVGSVDGRSGVDASDSYRRDPYSFNGSPRSLGERLLEEAFAARRLSGNARKQE
ncbi:hypothetical protein F5B22DRAFT_648491 [Xylaria bambusicola]|uniref:uncharacterized protein n=1 Tax=Xylaria bambusicola TaxID=326684 RepID=UPI002008600D|nr:uncharacterized protein F5B22DRAFT_648491 [Xylaria bambusicola]KAI0512640.1 hypothetical protein F5B22DRAFT_648491 [Xylaria bambusicola]